MQTFLPYQDFLKSAQCLDYRRLGKQRLEAKTILNILLNETTKAGWTHHPAVLMWSGYEDSLKLYHDIMIYEWIKRGYKNTMTMYILDPNLDNFDVKYVKTKKHIDHFVCDVDSKITYVAVIPEWLTDKFCSYHRATLKFKNSEHYAQFGWVEEPKYEYLWPTKSNGLTPPIEPTNPDIVIFNEGKGK